MSTSQLNTKTAAARRSAEAELHRLIGKFAPAHQGLIGTMRRKLRKRLPLADELVYEYKDFIVISYSPNEHGYEGVFAIRASATGVKLYFTRGKELPDPEKLLQGLGNQARWIHLEDASTVARPAVALLMDEAVAGNRGSFAPSGPGASGHSFEMGQAASAASRRLTMRSGGPALCLDLSIRRSFPNRDV